MGREVSVRDAEFLERLHAGDTNALRDIVRQYTDKLLKIAEISTHSYDLADEAVHAAFLDLWDQRAQLGPNDNLYGFLITVTRRRAISLMRREQGHTRGATKFQLAYPAIDPAYNEGEFAAEHDEAMAVLWKALADVQPRAREIYLLSRQAGLSYEEIEKLLGISNGTVRLQISKAAARVGQALKDWMSKR